MLHDASMVNLSFTEMILLMMQNPATLIIKCIGLALHMHESDTSKSVNCWLRIHSRVKARSLWLVWFFGWITFQEVGILQGSRCSNRAVSVAEQSAQIQPELFFCFS